MKKLYVLTGVGVAVLVAAVIVVVGTSSGGSDAAGTVAERATAGQSLPPGHPAIDGKAGESTPAPVANDAVQQKIAQLQRDSTEQPDDVAVLLELGDAYFLGQRYQQAARTFRAALLIDPGNPTATVRLAMVWQAEGQTQRATTSLSAVLAKDPGQQEAHYSMAIILFSQNDIAGAKSQWGTAARIDPKSTIGRRSQSFVDLLEGKQSAEPEPGSSN